MTTSEAYYKKAKDSIRKSEGQGEDAVTAGIREILFQFLGDLPTNLQHDIFNFYNELYLEQENATLYDLAQMPMKMIDFITGQLSAEEADFSEEEWDMIREGINANADTIDLRLLNQIMKVMVEKKKY